MKKKSNLARNMWYLEQKHKYPHIYIPYPFQSKEVIETWKEILKLYKKGGEK